jgi:hypothetical protein
MLGPSSVHPLSDVRVAFYRLSLLNAQTSMGEFEATSAISLADDRSVTANRVF